MMIFFFCKTIQNDDWLWVFVIAVIKLPDQTGSALSFRIRMLREQKMFIQIHNMINYSKTI